ncbi:GNAT family N-acetyltransferase [Falsibacillus pallidus]|uniref:GNAT family N-acetyltransferase n=1 Tax=Falsibacillus pallidus TaxID=493781 RepID=UPI003D965A9D
MNEEMQDTYRVVPFEQKYADQTVQMWRDSKEAAIGQKEIHSFESHLYFLNEILPKEFEIDIVLLNEQVVGIMAYNENEISQLYVHNDYQGKGIGKVLLSRAKEKSSGCLSLYTFEINEKAQKFYSRNGFEITARGHENEENLPDVRMEWKL